MALEPIPPSLPPSLPPPPRPLSLSQVEILMSLLRENVPEDRVKSRKCGTCLEN